MNIPLDQQHSFVPILPGYGGQTWAGIFKDGARTVIPDGAMTNLINVRFVNHEIVVRGGQSKDNTSQLVGRLVSGIWESTTWGDEPTQRASSRIFYIQEP